jgi:hypothetical protein
VTTDTDGTLGDTMHMICVLLLLNVSDLHILTSSSHNDLPRKSDDLRIHLSVISKFRTSLLECGITDAGRWSKSALERCCATKRNVAEDSQRCVATGAPPKTLVDLDRLYAHMRIYSSY